MIDLRHGLRVLLFGVAALASFFLLFATGDAIIFRNAPTETTFNVEAETERLELDINTVVPFRWALRNATVIDGRGDPLALTTLPPFSGALKIDPPARVQIERVAFGPVTIDIHNPDRRSVGVLYDEKDEPSGRLGHVVQITIADLPKRAAGGERLLFQLAGAIRTGRPIGSETDVTSMLRSGKVTLLSRPFFGGDPFEALSTELRAGDSFSIDATEKGGKPIDAVGVVVADERPALLAVYRVIGSKGVITRPGGGERSVSVTRLRRLIRDSLVQAVAQGILFVVATVGFVSAVLQGREAWRAGREHRR